MRFIPVVAMKRGLLHMIEYAFAAPALIHIRYELRPLARYRANYVVSGISVIPLIAYIHGGRPLLLGSRRPLLLE